MYTREHHRLIASVLNDMDAEILGQTHCFFGGGTAIAMQLDEYRKSVDVDFLIRDEDGYRWLRNEVSDTSFGRLFTTAPVLVGKAGIRKDRYGIRALLNVGGTPLKFEIVSEGRIDLRGQDVAGIPVPVIDRDGLFAEKLLANADRWAAAETFSRDVIDLAFMVDAWGNIPISALEAARRAYGNSIDDALKKAAERVANPEWLQRCCDAMEIDREKAMQVTERFARCLVLKP